MVWLTNVYNESHLLTSCLERHIESGFSSCGKSEEALTADLDKLAEKKGARTKGRSGQNDLRIKWSN